MPTEYLKTREEYISGIRKELLGPGSEGSLPDEAHERITATPRERYSIGILYPRNEKEGLDAEDLQERQENPENGDVVFENEEEQPIGNRGKRHTASGDNEEDLLDEQIGLAQQNKPSSMGLSFFVKGCADKIHCEINLAKYRKAQIEECLVSASLVECLPDNFSANRLPEAVLSFIHYDEELKAFTKRTGLSGYKNAVENANISNEDKKWLNRLEELLKNQYVRIPFEGKIEVDFSAGNYISNCITLESDTGEKFECTLAARRMNIKDDIWSLTFVLVNNEIKKDDTADSYTECIFQPQISVNSADNGFVFIDFSSASSVSTHDDKEEVLNQIIYRNKKTYASGHGVSADWMEKDSMCSEVRTEYFPTCEVPQMDFSMDRNSSITYVHGNEFVLSMKDLSDLSSHSKEECLEALSDFLEDYKTWIDSLKDNNPDIYSQNNKIWENVADECIENCRKSYQRMLDGLELLRTNEMAWTAFQLANRAMFMQRIHIVLQELTSKEKRFDGDDALQYFDVDYSDPAESMNRAYGEFAAGETYRDPTWRPFQLAFLLLSLKSMVFDDADDVNPERDIVDLIWFPTGGGKTEAYLGLTAFTIFYRRLRHQEDGSGTTVIMRYTLRLLTSQQFTRASTLICACEYIRDKYPDHMLGDERISIGLWIGGSHTPNEDSNEHFDPTREDSVPGAEQCVEQLNNNNGDLNVKKEKYNKFQVLKCPWCGAEMTKSRSGRRLIGDWGYKYSTTRGFYMECTNQECFFHDKSLPIQVVDEELYKNPPTLLFATVDKFAMIPFKAEISKFFGINAGVRTNRSPELVIQDELHLISGPLGTIVGQYETAFDYLCRKDGNRYKIIASTATIRRAKQQCAALYNREVSQFPSPGLVSSDSYFAKEMRIDYTENKYGRVYVGLMPSGKTKATMEVRSISSMVQLIKEMSLDEDTRDKLWTLTVYFGSLRDLGKARTLVEDDIAAAVGHMAKRHNKEKRYIGLPDELTSRVTTTELNETLTKLEKVHYSDNHRTGDEWPSNVLLATNMISVGIDVARLNVMLLVGQPKLTSEYIQASSRIGRSYPGVAFALYDSGKSRDRSHYEQFVSYHESFYRYVEPTGVTPFSKPARERALHSLVVAMMRHSDSRLSESNAAGNLNRVDFSDLIDEVKYYISERNREIISTNNPNMKDNTREIISEIEDFLEEWLDRISAAQGDLSYGNAFPSARGDTGKLLKPFGSGRYRSGKETMTSMRNVDESVPAHIVIW